MLWGNFSKRFFCPVFQGVSSLRNVFKKFSKFQKWSKSFLKVTKRVLNMLWGNFLKNFFAQCSKECRVFEMFLKNFQTSKKCPKSFPKVSKRVLNLFWGNFIEKFFLPSVPCRVESSKWSQKIKIFQNSKKAQNRSQKRPNIFWKSFGVIFSKKLFCPVFHGGSSLRNVFKKFSKFKKRPKSFPICPNVFWTCFG